MGMTDQTQTPAGWYPDPEKPGQQRYWDGATWAAPGAIPPPPQVSASDARAQAKAAKAYAKAKRPFYRKKRWWLVAVIVVVIIVIAVASNSSKSNNTASNVGGSAPAAAYKVGDTATTSGFQVTVYGFKDPQPPADSFSTPTAGDHFVSVDVQVRNPNSGQQVFSSLVGFHLLDSLNHQYDEDLVGADLKPGAPDGQIAGGQSIRGFVVFDVPNGTAGLKFRAQGSITAAGAVWTL